MCLFVLVSSKENFDVSTYSAKETPSQSCMK